MDSPIMFRVLPMRRCARTGGRGIGHSRKCAPASAMDGEAPERGTASVELAQACGTLGRTPYTIPRANQVAYEAGSLGLSTRYFTTAMETT